METDDVDDIIAQWSAARPDADLSPFAVLSRITRLSRQQGRERAAAFAGAGLEPWEWDVLAALRRFDTPLSPKQLIQQTMVTSGTMTNRIDNLIARGLVERVAHDEDKRVRRIRITPEGIDRVDTALDALLEREHDVLAGFSIDDQVRLVELLRRLGDGLAGR